jgi:SAM-dependent methyltransferase
MRNKWSIGYVSDMTYSHGYYHELSPPFIRFFLLMNGFANASQGGGYSYCELGFGQGVSCNLHAAANPRGRFHGTDFYPDHALFAQQLAAGAQLDANWLGLGFEEMLDADLPQFDFITLHGVWSWIDAAARHAVVEFLRRRLKVGGVVYTSYNVMPGWSAEKPLRDLLWLHTELAGAGSTDKRIRGALDFAQRLREGKAAFFDQNTRAGQMLDDMLRDDLHVVAHEYFNRSWHLTYFADLARDLEAGGLSFACSLHRSDLTGEVFHRTRGMQIGELEPALRQTTNDFILNRRFRRDVFVRGASKLPALERDAMLKDVAVTLMRAPGSISPTLQTPYGSVTLDASITRQIAQVVESSAGPVRIADLIKRGDLSSTPLERVFETVAALVAQSQLAPVFADDARQAASARARAMNQAIADRACLDNTLRYLASPVTGQGMEASRIERLFLFAWEQGARQAPELAAIAWPLHAATTGAAQADAQARGDIETRAAQFLETTAPLWTRLGILQEAA